VFFAGPGMGRPTAAAQIGAHTRQALSAIGYSSDQIDSMIRRGIIAEPR